MAISVKLKAKPKQKSRAVIKSIDDKNYGAEPIVVSNYRDALNWYNYMYSTDQARDWVLEYMKKSGYDRSDIAAVRRTPKWTTPTTIGWQARMMLNGNTLDDSSMEFFKSRLAKNIEQGKNTVSEEDTPRVVVNIQDRVRDKADFVITAIEEELDLYMEGKPFDMYTFCQTRELNPAILSIVKDYYQPQFDEIMSSDEQVKEAFGKSQKNWINFWKNFFADIDRFLNNKKAVKVRKPREKKVKSAVDLIKNLKYQKEEPSLKIVSVHPAEIVGCNQLWVYNTKYKKLTQYLAMGPAGIQVKGTTLTGWDTESSVSKSLRKPEIATAELLKAGKVTLRSFMSDLKTTASKPNGRINQDTILLRVIK